ncbi:recombinase family protein [Clostridium botulinum]|uniref:recombinase family protein n=2 Tax=Clostridium botulinum TaxID=1491 RepID=UPI003703ED79
MATGYIKFYYIFIVEGDVHMLYFAYHRTSTEDQHLDRGLKEINEFIANNNIELVGEIYTDQCTGKNFDRPQYKDLMKAMYLASQINPDEKISLIVTELDRLGRNKQLTLKEIRKMQDNGIRLMVLEIPTTLTELPKDNSIAIMIMETINNMLIEMYASFAQAELEKKEKRQREGIAAKKARGEWEDYGRPRVLNFDKFCKEYKRVLNGDIKPVECMKLLGITKPTYYRYRKEYEESKLI